MVKYIETLSRNLLKADQQLAAVKYFTARISGPALGDRSARSVELEASRKRQLDYLEALNTVPLIQIFYGHYLAKTVECARCHTKWAKHEEKMTDVNIAVQLMIDAYCNNFDSAMIISADSDQIPPVRAIRRLFPEKRIVIAFPPNRSSIDLGRSAHAYLNIGNAILSKSLFPDQIHKSDGYILKRPETWR